MCIMQMVLESPYHFVSQVSVASDCAGYLHILTSLCQKSQESPKRSHELLSLQPSLINNYFNKTAIFEGTSKRTHLFQEMLDISKKGNDNRYYFHLRAFICYMSACT